MKIENSKGVTGCKRNVIGARAGIREFEMIEREGIFSAGTLHADFWDELDV